MKALVKTAPVSGIKLQNVEIPCINEDQVLIKINVAAICGSDLHIYFWEGGYDFIKPFFPLIIGHEFVGYVEKKGANVKNVNIGDRVVCMPGPGCGKCDFCMRGKTNLCIDRKSLGIRRAGAFAEYVAAQGDCCFTVPKTVSDEAASLTEPLAVAMHLINKVDFRLGDNVVVFGCGAIGLLDAMLIKQQGCKVILCGCTSDKMRMEIGRKIGADYTIDVQTEDYKQRIKELTGGKGADYVIEASGASSVITDSMDILNKMGSLVIMGIHGRLGSFDPAILVRQEKNIIASFGSTLPDWQRTMRVYEQITDKLGLLVTHKLPIEKYDEAFALARKPEAVKVLLVP